MNPEDQAAFNVAAIGSTSSALESKIETARP